MHFSCNLQSKVPKTLCLTETCCDETFPDILILTAAYLIVIGAERPSD